MLRDCQAWRMDTVCKVMLPHYCYNDNIAAALHGAQEQCRPLRGVSAAHTGRPAQLEMARDEVGAAGMPALAAPPTGKGVTAHGHLHAQHPGQPLPWPQTHCAAHSPSHMAARKLLTMSDSKPVLARLSRGF